jgi:hypothetical protein
MKTSTFYRVEVEKSDEASSSSSSTSAKFKMPGVNIFIGALACLQNQADLGNHLGRTLSTTEMMSRARGNFAPLLGSTASAKLLFSVKETI